MIEALQPLAELPGVRLVMLVTLDGVPVAVPGIEDAGAEADGMSFHGKNEALAAIASGWLGELTHSVAPLSWSAPKRVVMKAARGTLVMQKTKSAILVLILARGMAPEEVRLSMDGTIARIERSLRSMGRDDNSRQGAASAGLESPPSALPKARETQEGDRDLAETQPDGQTNTSSDN